MKLNDLQPIGTAEGFLQEQRALFATFSTSDGFPRRPSLFEIAVAEALFRAAVQAYTGGEETCGRFVCVSCATGGGKTTGAVALLSHLLKQGKTGALLIPHIRELEEVYRSFVAFGLKDHVAVWSSIHRADAPPREVDKYREEGVTASAIFTAEQFKAAPIVLTTHRKWRDEIEKDADFGVRKCKGIERDLIVVDEEPEIAKVYVFRASEVGQLAELYTTIVPEDDPRTWGRDHHPVLAALRSIEGRMQDILDGTLQPQLLKAEIVTPEERGLLVSVADTSITQRLSARGAHDLLGELKGYKLTLDAIKAAGLGRIFYAKSEQGGEFYAYDMSVAPQGRTIILDGTADLNGFYPVSPTVHSVEKGPKPDYRTLKLVHVRPPKEFRGKLRPDGVYKTQKACSALYEWLKGFILERTQRGDRVLVYAKQDFFRYTWLGVENPSDPLWDGRLVHFVHFGMGRGSNAWKDCNVFIRLSDWYPAKAQLLAKLGSVSGRDYTASELKRLSSGTTTDPLYVQCREAFLNVGQKQDLARTAVRNLGDDGTPRPVTAYLIDVDLDRLVRYQELMFPGSPPVTLMQCGEEAGGTRAEKLAVLLRSAEGDLEGSRIAAETGVTTKRLKEALEHPLVAPIAKLKGWRIVTRKERGLFGKGLILTLS